jgi:hypothetical protein
MFMRGWDLLHCPTISGHISNFVVHLSARQVRSAYQIEPAVTLNPVYVLGLFRRLYVFAYILCIKNGSRNASFSVQY